MMLPSPKIVVVDDNLDDVQAIVAGLAALGTTALGFHYSPDVDKPLRLAGVRILFLDLHLTGTGDSDQQIKSTIGILESFLTPENGPYAIVLWSGHILGNFERFKEEIERRLPAHFHPLQIVPLSKTEFIEPKDGRRQLVNLEGLKDRIMENIASCPQLAALLSWEDSVSRAAADAVHEIFQMACRRSSASSAEEVALVLGELAVAAVGPKNAEEEVFRGVNNVLVQVVADRLQHRTIGKETAELWQKAVVLREKSAQGEGDAATLNRFLHVEDGALLSRLQPWERGSVVGIPVNRLVDLCGFPEDVLLKEVGLASTTSYTSIEWVMAQVQPPCDHAQRHTGLLPYVLGLRICELSRGKVSDFKDKKNFWLSPPLKLGSKVFRLLFLLRFVVGLHRDNGFLDGPMHLRLRDQLLAELTHELYSYSGRPGVIRFR